MGKMKKPEAAEELIEEDDEGLEFEDPDKFEITEDPELLERAFKNQSFKYPLLRRTGQRNSEGKELVAKFWVEYIQLSWDRVNSLRHGKKLPKSMKRINAPFTKELTLPILQAGIKFIIVGDNKYPAELIDGKEGSTNLRRGVLNFNDLLPGQVKELEDLIAPGLNKISSSGEKRAISADGPAREAVRETAIGTDGSLPSMG